MRIFEEEQRYNQWWLYAIFTLVFAVLLMGIYNNSNGFTNFQNPIPALSFLAGLIPIAVIIMMKLETRIDQKGIKVKFSPLGFTENFFSWENIEECYVREYSPIAEFGGWGIRGFGKRRAYNVSGNLGIQIVTREKKNFLIGTRDPAAARTAIKNFEHKINSQSNKNLV